MRVQAGRESAFVAHRGRQPLPVEQFLQRVENLRAAAQRIAKARRADRHDHEFLQVERVVGVRAAVDHVDHRHRHLHLPGTAEIAVQRQPGLLGRRLGDRHRYREQRIRAEPGLVLRAVELDQRLVDEALLGGIEADDRFGDLRVHVLDRAQHALAAVAPARRRRAARSPRGCRSRRPKAPTPVP